MEMDGTLDGVYQNVIFKLSDGRTIVFSGPAFAEECDNEVMIKEMYFTKPKKLPIGYSFSPLEDDLK